jgi:glycosyltransferase involved in cell wall biosynthesis
VSGRREPRIGVSANLLTHHPTTGHGRVWTRVVERLRDLAPLIAIDPTTARPLRRFARRPQVVLADGHETPPPTALPIVVQVHEAAWFEPELRDLLDPGFYAHIAPRTEAAVRAAERVITPSEAARRDVIAAYGIDSARVHAVPHGVDPAFHPEVAGGRALVGRLRGGAPGPYVLYAAMLHPRKNLGAVRAAMAALAAEGFPHVLVVAGGPATDRADSSALERSAASDLPGAPDRIVRIDRPSDEELAGLMAEADAFCLPSLYEGFGLTALEAMACGAPVVVSNRGALPEVVGDAGIVTEPTGDAVAAALRTLLADPSRARELGAAAAARARGFTWERTATGWLEVLRNAAGGLDGPPRS